MKTKPDNELYRIQHRIVAHYLALQAWVRCIDCIVLVRGDLKALFDIENTGKDRLQQLIADMKPWFSCIRPYYREGSETYVRCLFLSRVEFNLPSQHGRVKVTQLMEEVGHHLPRIGRFSKKGVLEVPSHIDIVSNLALFAAGMKTP